MGMGGWVGECPPRGKGEGNGVGEFMKGRPGTGIIFEMQTNKMINKLDKKKKE